MDKAKLFEMLLATFVDELSEHVESLNSGVLNLESLTDDAERLEALTVMFRAAHSLKGAARSVDALPIEAVCHPLRRRRSAQLSGVAGWLVGIWLKALLSSVPAVGRKPVMRA